MEQARGMTVHFMDGSQMRFTFPRQIEHDSSVPVRLERMLEKNVLLIEADGSLMAIPISSIKYLQSYPAPGGLPDYVIKQASLIE
jgi:hypothetical protein